MRVTSPNRLTLTNEREPKANEHEHEHEHEPKAGRSNPAADRYHEAGLSSFSFRFRQRTS
jgi:hypothetical protein